MLTDGERTVDCGKGRAGRAFGGWIDLLREGGCATLGAENYTMLEVLKRAGLWRAVCVMLVLTAAARARAGDIGFDVNATRAEVGRTRVIAFGASAREVNRTFEAAVSDGGVLEIVRQPEILAGSKTGFVRVRGLKEGEAKLTIGGAAIRVEVVKARVSERAADVRIIEPASGAAVWGAFAVGVEVDQSAGGEEEDPKVELDVSSGEKLSPAGMTDRSMGPVRRVWFTVDTTQVAPGALELRVAGSEERIRVRVVKPPTGTVTKIEAEEPFTGERPERYKRDKVSVQKDAGASGGKFVANGSAEPAVCVAYHAERAGWYQAFVTAAGDFAGGAYPTVGLVVDGAQYPATNGRLCTEGWHRLALGVPVKLEAGDHVLTPLFMNDFYAGRGKDRNLRLDCLEIARVEGAGGAAGGGGMMGEGMAGEAMSGGGVAGSMEAMAGGMAGGAMAAGDSDGSSLDGQEVVRIGLSRPLDGLSLTGGLMVDGYCWFEGLEANPPVAPPMVTLLINGETAGRQWAVGPRFFVGTEMLRSGKNTIQLTARLASGAMARTAAQTVMYAPPAGGVERGARPGGRFTVFDPRWEADVRGRVQRENGLAERTAAVFSTDGAATLNVPEEFEGAYELLLEARGQDFKGPAVATVRLSQGGETTVVKELPLHNRWETQRVDTVQLKKGAKQIWVAFENDAYEEGKGDRNLYLQSVELRPVGGGADKTGPAVSILYPGADARCYMADAVVASAADDRYLAWAELEIDGKGTGIRMERPSVGPLVFPLPLRSVAAGKHELSVRAADGAGNEMVSKGVGILVAEKAPSELGRYDRAVRLLDRFGFGPDARSLADVLTRGEQAWLSGELSRPLDDAGLMTSMTNSLARFPNGRGGGAVQQRAVMNALTTDDPVRERFVLWTENHFSTWIRKTEGTRKWSEHVAFEELGVAPFADLLRCSSRSAAMLRYLDQEESYAKRLNENYAREIMELHCLGVHAGYTQQDVTSMAHLLTGWTVSREGDGRSGGEMSEYNFRFDPSLNDRGEITVFGARYPATDRAHAYERVEEAMEVLAARPEAAKFVCGKLADHYLGCPAPEGVVNDLARVFEATGGDMREVLLALSRHPAFWEPEAGAPRGSFPAQRLAHPQDFGIRLARVSGNMNAGRVVEFLSRTGQNLFDRATPDGYPELDSDYTDSNAMIQRWRMAQDTAQDLAELVPEPFKVDPPKGSAPDAAAEAAWAQRVVDVVAIRLTGRVLSPASNDAALTMLSQIEGRRRERIQKFVPLMAQLPEANLR